MASEVAVFVTDPFGNFEDFSSHLPSNQNVVIVPLPCMQTAHSKTVILLLIIVDINADHFCGPRSALDRLCVCVSVCPADNFQKNNLRLR